MIVFGVSHPYCCLNIIQTILTSSRCVPVYLNSIKCTQWGAATIGWENWPFRENQLLWKGLILQHFQADNAQHRLVSVQMGCSSCMNIFGFWTVGQASYIWCRSITQTLLVIQTTFFWTYFQLIVKVRFSIKRFSMCRFASPNYTVQHCPCQDFMLHYKYKSNVMTMLTLCGRCSGQIDYLINIPSVLHSLYFFVKSKPVTERLRLRVRAQ